MTTFCFDIDGTICTQEKNYEEAKPFSKRIETINSLHDAGHFIRFFSSRGSVSGIDWFEKTERQLESWGVKYHELLLGKPHADIYVDDKACFSEDFDWALEKFNVEDSFRN